MAVMNCTDNKPKLELLKRTTKPAKAHPDTAATGHFFNNELKGSNKTHEPIDVICANSTTMSSTATKELIIPEVPADAKKAHIFPDMKKNLLSVPVMCDAGCICTFSYDKVVIEKDDKTIMTGPRDYATRLWTVPVEAYYNNRVIHTANSAYTQKSAAELYAYLHACLGYPTVATLIDAIKNNRLSTFPGLTV